MLKYWRNIVQLKCPRCHKGDLFTHKGLLRFTKILDMPEECSHCGLHYEIEPGFWIGALWTSYPFVVIIEFPFLLIGILYYEINLIYVMLGLGVIFAFTYSFLMRIGRSLWIYLSIPFDPKHAENH